MHRLEKILSKVQRWNWFLAADAQGKWITTMGYAEVTFDQPHFSAALRFSPDSDVYHSVSGSLDSEDAIEALVTSPNRDTTFELHGQLFRGAVVDGIETLTVLLTDGTTVLGLTVGPRSHESTL